jgi:hypothetical protein
MTTQSDLKFIGSAQVASLVAAPLWYPFFRMSTLAKQEILFSSKPNNMLHLPNFSGGNLRSVCGIGTYYKGLSSILTFQPVYPIFMFAKHRLTEKLFNNKPTLYQDCALSAGIGASTAFVATPLNVIVTQVLKNKDTKARNVVKSFNQEYGIKRFYSGFIAFTLRNSFYCTGLTVIYPRAQSHIQTNYPCVQKYKADVIGAGFISALLCCTAVDFFDIIGVMRGSYEYKNKSAIVLLQEIYIKHGVRGLFAGIAPKTMQATIEIIVFNETFKYLMKL